MNYKKVLEKLGFIEGVDFALTVDSFQMLQQSRMITQVIPHLEVTATFDVNNVELTPLIPAYDENVLVEELFTLQAPSLEVLDSTYKQIKLSESDISLLIGEYLVGKELLRDTENDSINIVNNNIHTWSFKNIPQPTIDELVALIPSVVAKQSQAAINKEALKYLADTDYLVIRMMDIGTPIPAGVQALRQAARNRIV